MSIKLICEKKCSRFEILSFIRLLGHSLTQVVLFTNHSSQIDDIVKVKYIEPRGMKHIMDDVW